MHRGHVCALSDLTPDRGVCALIDGLEIAIFLVSGSAELFAVSNLDPFSHVAVMARGVVGDAGGVLKVVSPLHKQAFDLRTGVCLDDPSVTLATYAVRLRAGRVELARPSES